jgi:tetratricopeptide (TPR) repeat protein
MTRKSRSVVATLYLLLSAVVLSANAQAQDKAEDLTLAHGLLERGKTDEAFAVLQRISARQPQLKGLAHEMGVALYKKSNFAGSIPSLLKAVDEDHGDKEAIQLLGLSYYFTGKFADAIPLLERSQSWYRVANVDALYVLGLCEIFVKNLDGARAVFAKMFDVPPDSGASYLFTARMLIRQDLGVAGESYAQKAVALDPKLPLAHYLLGELYLSQSKIPEALIELQKEMDVNPGYAGVYYKLADADMRLEKYEEAERLLQRSIWLDPASTGPYILLGKVLEKKGESELAVRTLRRALTMDPSNPISHYVLGQAYHQMGRNDEANNEFKLAEQLRQSENAKP